MFPVCGEDRGTTTTSVVVLVVDPVDSPSSNFEKFLRNFQNCEDGSTRSTPRKKVEEYLVVFSGSEDTLVKCLLRKGVLPLLLASAWVHCTLIVGQRGERAEFTSSSTVTRSLSLLSLLLTTLFLQRERILVKNQFR
jgi:hypothetical protein